MVDGSGWYKPRALGFRLVGMVDRRPVHDPECVAHEAMDVDQASTALEGNHKCPALSRARLRDGIALREDGTGLAADGGSNSPFTERRRRQPRAFPVVSRCRNRRFHADSFPDMAPLL